MIDQMLTVAACEIRIAMRNRWVLLSAVILLVFALVLGLVGTAPTGTVKAEPLAITVASLATLSVYLVPLIALLLAFDAIAGEVDRGTIQLVMASPISRNSFIAGKFLGHLAVIAIAVLLGYGAAGAIIYGLTGSGGSGIVDLVRLVATSIALGAAFLAIGYVASACVRQTGTAAALAVGIWLIAVVLYDLGLFGALVANPDGFFAKSAFPYLLAANPADAFRLYNMAALETGTISGGLGAAAGSLPFSTGFALASLCVWTILALIAAATIFRRLEP